MKILGSDRIERLSPHNALADPGTVSKALAEEHAHRQFERHDEARRLREASEPSDFDRFVEEAERISGERGETKA